MTEQVLALNANWTNSSPTVVSGNLALSNTLSQCDTGYTVNGYWYPYYQTLTWGTGGRIRLKMSEIERLRVAAKKDKAVREILEKFTDHIEVVVDFS